MRKLICRMIGVLTAVMITFLLGILVGAWFGNNYAAALQFNGVQGYGAAGQIGLLCAVFVLILVSAYYWAKGKNNKLNIDDEN